MHDNNFKYSISIPVPIGEKVWTFWTDCCMACYFQPRENKQIECNMSSPCHTFLHAVQAKELTYANLGHVLEHWGKRYFYTEQEARDAAAKLIETHRNKMKGLGYKLDENGIAEKEDGWEDKLDAQE